MGRIDLGLTNELTPFELARRFIPIKYELLTVLSRTQRNTWFTKRHLYVSYLVN